MLDIIDEFEIKTPLLTHSLNIEDIILSKEAQSSVHINVTIPKLLKTLAEKRKISPSKVLQAGLVKEFCL